jgi:hypothetical protein
MALRYLRSLVDNLLPSVLSRLHKALLPGLVLLMTFPIRAMESEDECSKDVTNLPDAFLGPAIEEQTADAIATADLVQQRSAPCLGSGLDIREALLQAGISQPLDMATGAG